MKKLILILIFGCLTACAPQYERVNKIAAPINEAQQECARNCDNVGAICDKMCKDNQARCFDLQRFSTRGGYNYNANDLFNSNHFYNCDFVLDGCVRDCAKTKLLCFKRCGLKITQEEICIENCDEKKI